MRLRMKGFGEPDIHSVLLVLGESGLLDERKLAASLRRYAEETKHLGRAGARRFLLALGIPSDLSDEAVKDIDDFKTARRFVERKIARWERGGRLRWPEGLDDATLKRLYGMLARRGYAPETIRQILKELKDEEES